MLQPTPSPSTTPFIQKNCLNSQVQKRGKDDERVERVVRERERGEGRKGEGRDLNICFLLIRVGILNNNLSKKELIKLGAHFF